MSRGRPCCGAGTSTRTTAAGGRAKAGCLPRAGSNRLLLLASSSPLQLLQDRVVPEVSALAKGNSHIRLGKYRASSYDHDPFLALEALSHAKKKNPLSCQSQDLADPPSSLTMLRG